MMFKLLILILSFLHVISGINYIGNGLSVEDYKKLSVCGKPVCVLDSERAISYASRNNQSNACLNMNEYACGSFFAERTEDVNQNVGFEIELEKIYFKQLSEVLKIEIEEEEANVLKIVKKYYQKCVNSTYVKNEGKKEAFSLLSEFGKFPAFQENWKETDFNLEKVMTTTILQENRILLCDKIAGESQDPLICFSILGFGKDVKIKKEVVRQMLKDGFNLEDDVIEESYKDYQDYDRFKDGKAEFHTTIDNIDSYLNIKSGINWEMKITSELEKQFYLPWKNENSKAIENNKVVIKENLKEILDVNNRRKLANIFMIEYLFSIREIFLINPIDNEEFKTSDYKRTKERFELCIDSISAYMIFPVQILHQKKFLSKSYKDSFKTFLNLELKINVDQHLELIKDWNQTVMNDLRKHVQDAPIFIGFPKGLTSPEFLEYFYLNLNLTGDEGLFKMNQEMKKHSNQMYHDFMKMSLENVSENEKEILKSLVLLNPKSKHYLWRYPKFANDVTLFHSTDILYPVYHPDRPFYINNIYLYDQMYEIFFQLLRSFMKKNNEEIGTSYTEPSFVDNVLYRNQMSFIAEFGVEENLPGILQTNHQMSYMILFQSRCRKDQNGTSFVDYFSTDTKGFKDAFKC